MLRKIQSDGVSSICWGIDLSHIILGYNDLKLYGIRSCTVLKEYNLSVNNDYVNKLLASENKIYAITNGGYLKIFSYSTQE